MRVAAYLQLNRLIKPTGVGKHCRNMVAGLACTPGVQTHVIASRKQLDADGQIPVACGLPDLPVRAHPFSRAAMDWLWALPGVPTADRWAGTTDHAAKARAESPADWIYCPAEVSIPARRSRVAITLHCLNWFERDLPWYPRPETRKARLRWRLLLGRAFASNATLLVVSNFMRDRAAALFGLDPQRMPFVGNGVEPAYFEPDRYPLRRELSLDGRPYVLVVGGLTERKGGDYTLAVARELQHMAADVLIVVIGQSEPTFAAQARKLPNVRELGYFSVDDGLPTLLKNAVALSFLSRYETFGIPAAEALCVGTPAILTRMGAFPELFSDAAIFADVHQPAVTAEIIRELARDPAHRRHIAERGLAIRDRFTWDTCVGRLVEALKQN